MLCWRIILSIIIIFLPFLPGEYILLIRIRILFYAQLVNPKSRPHNEAITAHILSFADLNMRTREGRNILMEAMYNRETEGIIRTILNAGINLAARDGLGRTARDHAEILKRSDYM